MSTDGNDEIFMRRCIQLARNGYGRVQPNPMVGCVIAVGQTILSEGWHHSFGAAHAEIEALQAVKNKEDLTKATLYVNLEPCDHYGKTPPCTEAIRLSGIRRVVYGSSDKKVGGSERLIQAGIELRSGVLKSECDQLNEVFLNSSVRQRPRVILKWAQTKNGFMGLRNQRLLISGREAQVFSHFLRAGVQAILVGSETYRIDSPKLNTRYWGGNSPTILIADRRGRLLSEVSQDSTNPVFITQPAKDTMRSVFSLPAGAGVSEMLGLLYKEGIHSLLVEGGEKILNAFIDSGLWDEAFVFKSPQTPLADIPAPKMDRLPNLARSLGADTLVQYLNP